METINRSPRTPDLPLPQDPWAEQAPITSDEQPDLAVLSRDEEAAFDDIVANYHKEAPSGSAASAEPPIKSHVHPNGEHADTAENYEPKHLSHFGEYGATLPPAGPAQDPWAEHAPIDTDGNIISSQPVEAANPPRAEAQKQQSRRRSLLGRIAARLTGRR